MLRPESLEVSVEVLEFAALDFEIVRDRGRRRVALVRTNSQKGNDRGDDFIKKMTEPKTRGSFVYLPACPRRPCAAARAWR